MATTALAKAGGQLLMTPLSAASSLISRPLLVLVRDSFLSFGNSQPGSPAAAPSDTWYGPAVCVSGVAPVLGQRPRWSGVPSMLFASRGWEACLLGRSSFNRMTRSCATLYLLSFLDAA